MKRFLSRAMVGLGALGVVALAYYFIWPGPFVLLNQAEKLTLYSLDPGRPGSEEKDKGKPRFRGYVILGKAELTDANEVRQVRTAINRGIKENLGTMALCFEPRHGIRVEQGERWLDLVICFQCLQIEAHSSEGNLRKLTSNSPQEALDRLLVRKQVELARD